ncbi:MAG: VWA domain-containing protein, partial [Planctomycetes bacterium]|nr:VWA domain-containing protein [Planctomycetota bacterium]
SQVATFAAGPVRRTRESVLAARAYLAAIRPTGGTNVHDALLEALRQPHTEGTLPIVLFLTDGLPTVGRTSEVEIREMVAKANVAGRRIFTFGVGNDVNVPLLDRISDATRATATYVLPDEDVELKVAKVFRRLYGPVLADVELEVVGPDGAVDTRRVRELMPERVPDLFEGDQLVLLGQYRGEEPLRFRLSGNFLG